MEKHYICTGGCKGVSNNPGVCQAETCIDHNHDLKECMCTDGMHNDFKVCENCAKVCKNDCQAQE